MVAKEKAKELVNRFSKLDKGLNEKEWKGKDVSFEEFHKQCALICVDEVLKELDGFGNEDGYQFSRFEFHIKVKEEINKL